MKHAGCSVGAHSAGHAHAAWPVCRHAAALHNRRPALLLSTLIKATDTATAAVSQEVAQQPEQPAAQPGGDADTAAAASGRRRRRTTAASSPTGAPSSSSSSSSSSKAEKRRRQQEKLAQLFQQQEQQQQQALEQQQQPAGVRVVRLPKQAAAMPRAALGDPTLAAPTAGQRQRQQRQQQQQQQQLRALLDPQLLSRFEPYADSFQQAAQRPVSSSSSSSSSGGDSGASAPSSVQQQQGQQQPQQQQQQPAAAAGVDVAEQQQQQQQPRRAPRDLLELFGGPYRSQAAPAGSAGGFQVTRLPKNAPLPQVSDASLEATQRLVDLLAEQRQRGKQPHKQLQQVQQQQQQEQEQEEEEDGAPGGLRVRLVAPEAAAPLGATRIYIPAPPLSAAASPEDRQPLRLLSIRQQQRLREEARRAAVKKLREKAVREYEAALQGLLVWQGASEQRTYLPAPSHLPVAVQRSWTASHAASSSSSTEVGPPVADTDATAPAVRSLMPDEHKAVKAISAVLQRQLGAPLPERAFRGERGLLLAGLSAPAVRERLQAWVGCCGLDYVTQLMTKEPSLLGLGPEVLLATLEGLNQELQLPPGECVAFALRHVCVIGLSGQELRQRLAGMAGAVGCEAHQAQRLATSQPGLLMMHPSHMQERMAALTRLLPEAAAKMPRLVVRHPFLLLKSPRALARSIVQLADALDLSSWAACRLVAGQPSILSSNFDALRRRLERLQQLTAGQGRWSRDLQALSPAALARCLVCGDPAFARLQQLRDIGAAGSNRLPPINLILTQPVQHFDRALAGIVAAQEAGARRAAAAAAAASVSGDDDAAGQAGADRDAAQPAAAAAAAGAAAGGSGSKAAAKAAAAAAIARLRSGSSSGSSSSSSSRRAVPAVDPGTESEDEAAAGVMGSVSDGLLGADAAWKHTLAAVLSGAAEDLSSPGGRGVHTAPDSAAGGGAEGAAVVRAKVPAASGAGRDRRRR